MSFSLPGTDFYYLPRDDLAPEKYEEIISPRSAWSHIDSKYVFDDRPTLGFQLINMHEREFSGYSNQPPPHGPRERDKLKRMLFSGEVVMLGGFSASKGWLFYIDEHGELICRDPLAFKFDGAQGVIREYKRSIARRDYSRRGGKPRATVLPAPLAKIKQPAPLNTINSKAAGRLLAAGGIYNGNPDGFRQTAEQLGGEAPAGYDQMMSDQAKGLLIAGASIAAGLTMGRLRVGDDKIAGPANKLKKKGSNFATSEIEARITAANKPINNQGMSTAARAWEKHSVRPEGTFEPIKGSQAKKNAAAESFIRDVLHNPDTVRKELSRGGVDYRLPNGRGIRFNPDGSFNTLLDPPVKR
ncbi:hypothetical protein [Mixta theicola]|uniref:hypothetical protein n=1 Tax=Mixta theicola TaxID=1458355 RepID=UPI001F0C5D6C|nr:hypothetical protein [Mixta theicola]GLR08323.1 hypothetical protein GCM10007905_10420 [Mixta theicola]